MTSCCLSRKTLPCICPDRPMPLTSFGLILPALSTLPDAVDRRLPPVFGVLLGPAGLRAGRAGIPRWRRRGCDRPARSRGFWCRWCRRRFPDRRSSSLVPLLQSGVVAIEPVCVRRCGTSLSGVSGNWQNLSRTHKRKCLPGRVEAGVSCRSAEWIWNAVGRDNNSDRSSRCTTPAQQGCPDEPAFAVLSSRRG